MVPVPLRHEHRRTMGPKGSLTSLQGEEKVQLPPHELSSECTRQCGLTTKRPCYLLDTDSTYDKNVQSYSYTTVKSLYLSCPQYIFT